MSKAETERPEIRFADEHVDQIMDGEKTVTIRYDFEHELEQGDLVDLVNQNGHKLTTAKIVTQCELRADWISFADFAGHRRYVTTGELLEELSGYYPDANLHPKVVLDVIVFETDLIVTDGGLVDGTEPEPCRHCGTETTQRAEGIPYCSMDCIGKRRREKRRETIECPYPDCEWETDYDPENSLSRDVAFHKAEQHRAEHRAQLAETDRPEATQNGDDIQ